METKTQIRNYYKAKRDAQAEDLRMQFSDRICEHILSSDLYQNANIVYFFYPLGSEASLLSLFYETIKLGKKAAFPKITGQEMNFFETKDISQLKEGYFHVMEPDETQPLLTESDPLILTPGLVFDKSGVRYGYGKGFYDKYFVCYPRAKRIGVAFELQIADCLKADTHDKLVEHIFTEKGCLF